MSCTIAGEDVPRWDPRILISKRAETGAMLNAFRWRAPAKFTAPPIQFSQPQRLFVTGDKFTIVAEREGLVPGSIYLFDEYRWADLFTPPPA